MEINNSELENEDDENDGGYYAIKGFLYQFDKSLIEILSNPDTPVEIENIQDVSFDKYVLQIKLKEAKDYFNSSIRRPVKQLIDIFQKDNTKKLILYCHFKNKSPESKNLTRLELEEILGKDKSDYSDAVKEEFVTRFTLQFSENYLAQFDEVIGKVINTFGCAEKELALIYHSILHSKLMKLAVLTNKNDRLICHSDLSKYLTDVDKRIFFKAYEVYLSREKYNKLIKQHFFTFNNPNINNFERLFIIETIVGTSLTDLIQITNRIIQRYYKLSKSPPPYLIFENIEASVLIELKRSLVDKNIPFTDGTTFNGDKFRLDSLLANSTKSQEIKIKFFQIDNLEEVLASLKFDEVFYLASTFSDNHKLLEASNNFLKIQISETNQILNFL